jgi:hypothetical protein
VANTIVETMFKAVMGAKKDSEVRQMFIAALKIKPVGKVDSWL